MSITPVLITGVLCWCSALLLSALGLRWFVGSGSRPSRIESDRLIPLRAMAPAQLAAAIMLAAGGLAALAGSSDTAVVIVVICIAGAVGTLAVSSWQSARFVVRRETVGSDCGSPCASCTVSCLRSPSSDPENRGPALPSCD